MISKADLRRRQCELRRTAEPSLGEALVKPLFGSVLVPPASVIAAYWPLRTEIDVRPVMRAAAELGHTVALPATPNRAGPLGFRRWQPGAALVPGRFGTMEAAGEWVVPDVVLVPLLAFDRRGGRLGYGGGFYDRTLAALGGTVIAVGCGYASQEVDMVPCETHDRPMDAIVTEAGIFLVE